MKVTIDEKAKTATIVVSLEGERVSSTGKMTMIGGYGVWEGVGASYMGKPVSVTVNMGYKNK